VKGKAVTEKGRIPFLQIISLLTGFEASSTFPEKRNVKRGRVEIIGGMVLTGRRKSTQCHSVHHSFHVNWPKVE
jgi:hypothetical protein